MISIFIFILGTIVLTLGISFLFTDKKSVSAYCLLMLIMCVYAFFQPSMIKERKENPTIYNGKAEECIKPKLESEIDGIKLYSYSKCCGCDVIYFSK